MKKILFLLFFFGYTCPLWAQIGAELIQFRPNEDMGAIMNKKITGELMYLSDFDNDNVRNRYAINYIVLKARMDTFPVSSYNSLNGTVVPGWEVFHKYNLLFVSGGLDYRVINHNSFYAYIGADVLIGALSIDYDVVYQTLENNSYLVADKLGGVRLRVGAEYMFNDNIGTFAEIVQSGYYIDGQGFSSNTNIGIGVQYLFN